MSLTETEVYARMQRLGLPSGFGGPAKTKQEALQEFKCLKTPKAESGLFIEFTF